ncbi:transposase [Aestuariibacter sp. A3R04]|uniref:transposase n=1 Tax=Aestuariibacter sp. A3R04 TaxID=2841571 RepID=UPI001C0A5085|nr:transposase [Aestuariibacter sp. A3R04]
MARKLRTSVAGVPQLIQRLGRDDVSPFIDDTDKLTYLDYLSRYASRYGVAMHSWCAAKNSILLLCTPSESDSISLTLQATGRLYAQFYHQRHGTQGSIWRDRYKSALVLDDHLLLEVYRYVEQKPVTEGLCEAPEYYAWSSAGVNALNAAHPTVQPHNAFLRTAAEPVVRQRLHLQRLHDDNPEADRAIEKALRMGLAMGDEGFIRRIEQVTGRRLTEGKRGRPRKYPPAVQI